MTISDRGKYVNFLDETLKYLNSIGMNIDNIEEFHISIMYDSKLHNIAGHSCEDFINNIEVFDTLYNTYSFSDTPDGWISFKDGSWIERECGELISMGCSWEYKKYPTNKI